MKYLKSYKLFENNLDDIKSYINDIFLDLTDRGLFSYIDANDTHINILELAEQEGLFYKVRLEFQPSK